MSTVAGAALLLAAAVAPSPRCTCSATPWWTSATTTSCRRRRTGRVSPAASTCRARSPVDGPGGSPTATTWPTSSGNGTITLQEQIKMFADTKAMMIEANKLGNNRVNRLLSQSLFLISTAGNDFMAFGDGRATRSDASAYIAKMVTTYLKHIKELYRLGARRLGLLDALPIGCLPGRRTSFGHDGACDAAANSLARRFNALLRLEMASATAASMPGMEYSIASIYGIFSNMITNQEPDNGRLEATSACCGGGRLNAEVDCSASSNLCTDRNGYVFWDKVHGTQAAYQRAVAAMFDGAAATKFTEPVSFGQLITGKQAAPVAVLDKLERPYADLKAEI